MTNVRNLVKEKDEDAKIYIENKYFTTSDYIKFKNEMHNAKI